MMCPQSVDHYWRRPCLVATAGVAGADVGAKDDARDKACSLAAEAGKDGTRGGGAALRPPRALALLRDLAQSSAACIVPERWKLLKLQALGDGKVDGGRGRRESVVERHDKDRGRLEAA
mmetsp:Transcript_76183/g.218285  ORF Transcript_76183/g.218285 Transcript_76183/m.218285 type:complete len:119 (+) Transcript_76183:33-389(+)